MKTKLIHAGQDRDPYTGASSIPIYQVSTYHQEDPEHLGRYDYARSDNPTREALEQAIAELEGGTRGFAFASGMAASPQRLMIFQAGDHLVVGEDIYGGTYRILTTVFKRWGLKHFVDSTDLDQVAAAITPQTKAIFVETPSNPTLKITDLAAVAEIARSRGFWQSPTTPSCLRYCSGRWSSALTSWCTAPPSSSAGTAISSPAWRW